MDSSDAYNGRLIMFGSDPAQPLSAFITGSGSRAVVVVGGQTARFYSMPYLAMMVPELAKKQWCTVQTLLSSCYTNNNATSISDADELSLLVDKLMREYGMTEIALYAVDTGVQVVMQFLRSARQAEAVTRVILQGAIRNPADSTAEQRASHASTIQDMLNTGRRELFVPTSVVPEGMSALRASADPVHNVGDALFLPAVALWNLDNRLAEAERSGADGIAVLQQQYNRDEEAFAALIEPLAVPLLVLYTLSSAFSPPADWREAATDQVRSRLPSDVQIAFLPEACDENHRLLRGNEAALTAEVVTFLHEQDRRRAELLDDARRAEEEAARRNRSSLLAIKGQNMKRSPSQHVVGV